MAATHHRLTWRDALASKANVTRAVILRDVRTRFFDHGLGFLIVPLWPLAHLFAISAMNTLIGRPSPFGESPLVFFATGMVPTLTFMYVSRFMSMSLLMNRPMLAFPVVQIVDIVFARAYLEIIGTVASLVLIFVVFVTLGEDPWPRDPYQAAYAFLAMVALAVGMGTIVSVVAMIWPFMVTAYALSLIVVYIVSGGLFVPSFLPGAISDWLAWNPVTQGIEWMRSAYYEGYPTQLLDKAYMLSWAGGSIFVGLALERIARGRALIG